MGSEIDCPQRVSGGREVLRHLGKLLELLSRSAALDVVSSANLLKAWLYSPGLRQRQHTLEINVALDFHPQPFNGSPFSLLSALWRMTLR